MFLTSYYYKTSYIMFLSLTVQSTYLPGYYSIFIVINFQTCENNWKIDMKTIRYMSNVQKNLLVGSVTVLLSSTLRNYPFQLLYRIEFFLLNDMQNPPSPRCWKVLKFVFICQKIRNVLKRIQNLIFHF